MVIHNISLYGIIQKIVKLGFMHVDKRQRETMRWRNTIVFVYDLKRKNADKVVVKSNTNCPLEPAFPGHRNSTLFALRAHYADSMCEKNPPFSYHLFCNNSVHWYRLSKYSTSIHRVIHNRKLYSMPIHRVIYNRKMYSTSIHRVIYKRKIHTMSTHRVIYNRKCIGMSIHRVIYKRKIYSMSTHRVFYCVQFCPAS